jgi:hypothetical protein
LHTVIAHDVRTNSPIISFDDNLVSGDALDETQFDVQDLWRHIRSLLTDAEEIRLAYLRFVLTMTPAEIVLSYPNMWKDERAVSVSLQRIRRKLRKDQYLRGLAGFSSETDPSDE